jgi:hypothetical protein
MARAVRSDRCCDVGDQRQQARSYVWYDTVSLARVEAEYVGQGHDGPAEEHEHTAGQNERFPDDFVARVQDDQAKNGAEANNQIMGTDGEGPTA